jgi:hypothetical protein
MAAARCPPQSDPQNSHDFRPSFGGVVREAYAPVLEEEGEACPALENVIDRFGQVVPASEPGHHLRTHIDMKVLDRPRPPAFQVNPSVRSKSTVPMAPGRRLAQLVSN